MTGAAPAVTVAIPTRNRPELVRRALDSVLHQTYADFEIVVVVDGPDPETEALLQAERDQRLRFHVNETSRGGAGARNAAASMARGHWIAFLDDDDIWLPTKLEHQLQRLQSAQEPVVSFTRLIAQAPHGRYLWPRRAPRSGEHLSEYLFVRRSLFAGEGGIQTSTIVAPRELLLQHPLDETLERLQDTDWLLRVAAAGARFDFCPEALTIWRIEEGRASITASQTANWRLLLDWVQARRHLVTKRAYASFLLVRGGGATAAARNWRAAALIWREAWRGGRPGIVDVLLFAGKWVIPAGLRATLRSRTSPGRLGRARDADFDARQRR